MPVIPRAERARRAAAARQHAIEEEQRTAIANQERQEALDRLRTTFDSRESIAADFDNRFVESIPAGLDIVRWCEELVTVESLTPTYPIRFPIVQTNYRIPGITRRRVSGPATDLSRKSRAFNITASMISGGNAHAIVLGGTSAHHPNMEAWENMAALAACIRGSACDLDRSYPRRIKSIIAVLSK